MKKIILIGSGAHASEIVDYIKYINTNSSKPKYKIIGIIDNSKYYYIKYGFKEKFIGDIENHKIDKKSYYVMGVGNILVRKKIIDKFIEHGAKFESIIHPTSLISSSAKVGEGCLISHNVSVGPKASIGDFCVINSRSTIGHDSTLGSNNFISPQVVLGGFSKIGDDNLLGTNSCLIPKIQIGNNNKIMAGMSLTKNIDDNETVFYRYKEKLIIRN